MKAQALIPFIAAIVLASGCRPATRKASVAPDSSTAKPVQGEVDPEKKAKDRASILAMAGRYQVSFHFEETVALKAGYQKKPIKDSGANELVIVIADEADFISLQHLLVVGEAESTMVIKHWRQDWRYEPQTRLRFIGGNSWERVKVPQAESRGAWSQTVYQVDDTPRYSGVGRWSYQHNIAEWTPEHDWRPLPRRDMTTRNDYHVVLGQNRHVLTPRGWVHEQDNTKIDLRTPSQALVRELAVNTYKRNDALDLSAASDYWNKTKDFWAKIRERWAAIEAGQSPYGLTIRGETQELYMPLMQLAQSVAEQKESLENAVKKANETIDRYLSLQPAPLQERLRTAAKKL